MCNTYLKFYNIFLPLSVLYILFSKAPYVLSMSKTYSKLKLQAMHKIMNKKEFLNHPNYY